MGRKNAGFGITPILVENMYDGLTAALCDYSFGINSYIGWMVSTGTYMYVDIVHGRVKGGS